MTTPEEIERRVADIDMPRSARRATAAKQVADLAHQRSALASQFGDIESQLGNILAAARGDIEVSELAAITGIPTADLTRWLEAQKPVRARRKKNTPGSSSPLGDRDETGPRRPEGHERVSGPANDVPASNVLPANS
ncbi:hypothetical protein [Allokutzneria sp. NRRL B-24872]|uniref:hypothetical protein n=1 Tax=Allokutzneria sp. NRRL B-24872 TaxID=1137961 RepID=UPI000A3D433F|nr:hypothetical protein [Allokutzneria sp. NRRL B-24872]